MLRGYRGIILAFGLILSAASPGGETGDSQQSKAQNEISQSLERIANALDEANKPKRETADCPEGGNDRKSDLCAQWKAADAAGWTVTIGWIGAVLGAITMGAAIAAAKFAKDAAFHTSESNVISRDIGMAQVSAYIVISEAHLYLTEGLPYVAFTLENVGQSPATDIVINITPSFRSFPETGSLDSEESIAFAFGSSDSTAISLAPGGKRTGVVAIFTASPQERKPYEGFGRMVLDKARKNSIDVMCHVKWIDVFDRECDMFGSAYFNYFESIDPEEGIIGISDGTIRTSAYNTPAWFKRRFSKSGAEA